MIHAIYVEHAVTDHPRTRTIIDRYPDVPVIPCERYGELFNRSAQNFRLQKRMPALILAAKQGRLVLEAPEGYGIGGTHNYYFSHMLNCVYDCRYCFLQGMYRSGWYVVFVNYEDFGAAIHRTVAETPAPQRPYFFSGYDCDSLAFEPVTRFTDYFLPLFEARPRALLELRTKSTQSRALLRRAPLDNCVIAFSFTPEETSRALEHGVPAVERRLEVMSKLRAHGWQVGLRLDPLIYQHDYRARYRRLLDLVFRHVPPESLHSVSLGAFRLPAGFFRNMTRLYPYEPLFAGPLEERDGMVGYQRTLEEEMIGFCREELSRRVADDILYDCTY